MIRAALLAAAATTLAASAVAQPQAAGATAELRDARGRVVGTVELRESPRGVLARIEARDMTPGWHGVHFHALGRCDDSRFQSAGGHTHVGRASVHGLLNPRATDTGDLPNVHAGPGGRIDAELFSPFVTLSRANNGRSRLLDRDGSAFMVHAQADDHASQPIGGSGDRVACGVIRAR